MGAWIGLLVGLVIGWQYGFSAIVFGGAIGWIVGKIVDRIVATRPRPDTPAAASGRADLTDARLAALDRRLIALEQAVEQMRGTVGLARSDTPFASDATAAVAPAHEPGASGGLPETEPAQAVPGDSSPLPSEAIESTLRTPRTDAASGVSASLRTRDDVPPPPAYGVAQAERPAYLRPEPSRAPGPPAVARTAPGPANVVWEWFTGGNALTRIGVVVLFFGVAFLLRYFVEHFEVPIELKLIGVATLGAALIGVGLWLAPARPGYGLSLEGAGAGVLYLTAFAALRLYAVIPAEAALVLLVAIAALTVWLAMRNDSQALAGLAVAGGFLAPFLVSTREGSHVLLFGYFAILNGAIFALAWFRAWRALNVLGFVFTFVLGGFWGWRYYRPEHFATVEPFLVLFFVYYVAIAVLYARRGALEARKPVDALLVFGVPLVGFALQVALVHDTRYGASWSAVALAAFYALLALALWRGTEPGESLLARSFLVLAIIFATVAVPFAADAHWTSAWWALEAAAVYWVGVRQQQLLARMVALLLQVGAAVAFVIGLDSRPDAPMFANATFIGAIMIGLAGLATAFVADRHAAELPESERRAAPAMFGWGSAWWIVAGIAEVIRELPPTDRANAALAWIAAGAAAALALRQVIGWRRLVWMAAWVFPAMAFAGAIDLRELRTTLSIGGWIVWPIAWALHGIFLWMIDAERSAAAGETAARSPGRGMDDFHALTAIAFVGWLAWEASEWVGRTTDEGTVWIACAAALPGIAYLAWVARAPAQSWPLRDHREAYAGVAGTVLAAALAAWFVIVNVVSPGDPAPLPYVPLANPLDLTLAAAIAAAWAWATLQPKVDERARYALLAVAAFIAVNGIVLRTGHHWGDIPWRIADLMASRPLQAALTLTWTSVAIAAMLVAHRRALRPLWMAGAALLVVVVAKLFLVDLGALAGLPRVVAFLGVGALLLVVGYFAPLPPAVRSEPTQ